MIPCLAPSRPRPQGTGPPGTLLPRTVPPPRMGTRRANGVASFASPRPGSRPVLGGCAYPMAAPGRRGAPYEQPPLRPPGVRDPRARQAPDAALPAARGRTARPSSSRGVACALPPRNNRGEGSPHTFLE
jgi:hypothetical protein